ncbi:MAG: hypothetical protein COU67_00875 [Candidatus Pacebacteria bacterium CG10_big_fil_rev_8_21_14_0_10_44_54]|nr:MAG: hypothetical protein COU67_00875 [Candidatus Pacebacteria bacterium CG10_big_fil_rev_8_21_14_0_10_44_54]
MIGNPYLKELNYLKEAVLEEISSVLDSGSYILGEKVKRFETNFSEYLEVENVVGVANGLDALQLILMALDIGKGDEVITTSLSAVATTLAITRTGATPVFVDIDEYFHIDATKIEAAITPRTKAVMPVHLYGQSVDLDKIVEICKENKIFLIEDAAQAQGAEFNGKKLGSIGEAGAFSFYPTKNLAAYGDAGAVSTSDSVLAEKVSMLRNYGQKTRYRHELAGINSRLDELQAAVLNVKLKYLDEWNKSRIDCAAIYQGELADAGDIKLPMVRPEAKHVFHQYVIRTKKRDELVSYLQENGVPALIHYPIPIHQQPCYPEFHSVSLPETVRASQEILSLPIHPFMSKSELLFVIEKVKVFFD